jgi:ribosomal protein S18 acetylase RimI-like enzyme
VDGDDPISDLARDVVVALDADNTICAVSPEGGLIAAGWVKPLDELRVAVGGKVHPDYRHQGLGNQLLAWAENRAAELVNPGKPFQLIITNESLSEEAHLLYMQWGYAQVMAEEMRVYNLTRPFPASQFPAGITRAAWSVETAGRFFQAYQDSFRDRPGFPSLSGQEWIGGNLESEGLRPALSTLALVSHQPIGFLTADVFSGLGWISQVGVVPAWRGKGLASALIIETLKHFKADGFKEVALHVNVNNPRAIHLYSQLGFEYRLKRARYVKEIKRDYEQKR